MAVALTRWRVSTCTLTTRPPSRTFIVNASAAMKVYGPWSCGRLRPRGPTVQYGITRCSPPPPDTASRALRNSRPQESADLGVNGSRVTIVPPGGCSRADDSASGVSSRSKPPSTIV